ncbi:hypothetical protein [Roseofilum casamattae]|uniref:PEP-CTERM sorting domain-containing protein n=1 Tax=Roseofilum casamattae BLCC-M143 TaxID=3022442 RepID=A0ABT7BSJ5_9CYAN|nr:hypothetical protein [Roseofilum casamattae]MDJ1182163.1 hypothetical protein [Roseofilum casamattae BLCC-M143]
MSSNWLIQNNDYTETTGMRFFTKSSGYVELQNTTTNESVSVPFLWFFWDMQYYYDPAIGFWNEYPNSSAWIEDMQMMQFTPTENNPKGNFYYLVLPETEEGILEDFSQAETSSLTFNSGQLDRVFESILGTSYEINELSLKQQLDVCDVANCEAQPVPEASSVFGVLSIGFIALGVAMKRKLFGR